MGDMTNEMKRMMDGGDADKQHPPLQGDWRPGDTAPKDGSCFLVAVVAKDGTWEFDTAIYSKYGKGFLYGSDRIGPMHSNCYWQPIIPPYEIETELQPCRWCGGEVYVERLSIGKVAPQYWVECEKCEARGPVADSAPAAREAWNKGGGE